jgi:hypothetical protein
MGTNALQVRIVGTNTFLLGSRPESLTILKTTPLASVKPLGVYDTGRSYSPAIGRLDFDVTGNRAYLADPLGLDLLDISNRERPMLLGRWTNAIISSSSLNSVRVQGDIAYFLDGNRLHLLNVSDPNHITNVSSVAVGERCSAVRVRDQQAFVVSRENGLTVFDISNPTNVMLLGTTNIGGADDLEIEGSYAYVALANSGMAVVDVSDPQTLKLLGRSSPAFGVSIDVRLPYVLLTHRLFGVWVLDVLNPANILFLTEIRMSGVGAAPNDATFGPNGIYLAGGTGLEIIPHRAGLWSTLRVEGPAASQITLESTVSPVAPYSWSPLANLNTGEGIIEFLDIDGRNPQKLYRGRSASD